MADVIKAAKEAGLKPERRKKESGPPQQDAEALQLTAWPPYEMEMRAHRDMLRNVIEDHREGYGTYTVEPEDPDVPPTPPPKETGVKTKVRKEPPCRRPCTHGVDTY